MWLPKTEQNKKRENGQAEILYGKTVILDVAHDMQIGKIQVEYVVGRVRYPL